MYQLIKPFLFLLSPEKAHAFTTTALRGLLKLPMINYFIRLQYLFKHQKLHQRLFGLDFKNPVGLAAGFDKNAELIDDFSVLGFGFIEIGTVTPKGQPGNEQPRLFRLKSDEALINRMGFNNEGVEAVVKRLKSRKSNVIVGGNIGKNKITPNDEAVNDYLTCFDQLFEHVDYFVVNVSSPNTPGLRELQEKEPLTHLLNTLIEANKKKESPKPILLKIAPDLTTSQLDDILDIVDTLKLDGLIISNTTIDRSNLKTNERVLKKIGAGGLSGAPLTNKSNEVLKYVRSHHSTLPVIAVGGIMTPQDAIDKINAGANLVQIYTGLVYKGPSLIKQINKALVNHLN
ncbi:MAG: quinone-dependent dihydroorotate dehydrogenase [Bacteroidota bacterium]